MQQQPFPSSSCKIMYSWCREIGRTARDDLFHVTTILCAPPSFLPRSVSFSCFPPFTPSCHPRSLSYAGIFRSPPFLRRLDVGKFVGCIRLNTSRGSLRTGRSCVRCSGGTLELCLRINISPLISTFARPVRAGDDLSASSRSLCAIYTFNLSEVTECSCRCGSGIPATRSWRWRAYSPRSTPY